MPSRTTAQERIALVKRAKESELVGLEYTTRPHTVGRVINEVPMPEPLFIPTGKVLQVSLLVVEPGQKRSRRK